MSESSIVAIVVALIGAVGGALAATIKRGPGPATNDDTGQEVSSQEVSSRRYPLIGGILGLVIGLLVGLVIGPFVSDAIASARAPKLPLVAVKNYTFDDNEASEDPAPWEPGPVAKDHKLEISSEDSRSGDHSLRLLVDMGALSPNEPNEYASVGLFGEKGNPDTQLDASVVWVKVPDYDASEGKRFWAHTIAYTYDNSGEFIALYGKDIELEIGEWTPVLWGAAYPLEESLDFNFNSWNEKISEWYLTVWSNEAYSGDIYFDDVTLFRTE